MKQRKYIVWMLIVVNLIMLTAAVMPHHHHQEILCLQHDIDLCGAASSQEQNESRDCKDCCVTKSFCFVQQHNVDYSPVYDLYPVTLFTLADILSLLPPEEEIHIDSFIYIEYLHGTRLIPSAGLRAPPSKLFA